MLRCSSDSLLRTVNEEFYFINAINSLGALHFSRWRTTGKYSNKTRERKRERARAWEKLGHISIRLGIIVDIRCRSLTERNFSPFSRERRIGARRTRTFYFRKLQDSRDPWIFTSLILYSTFLSLSLSLSSSRTH